MCRDFVVGQLLSSPVFDEGRELSNGCGEILAHLPVVAKGGFLGSISCLFLSTHERFVRVYLYCLARAMKTQEVIPKKVGKLLEARRTNTAVCEKIEDQMARFVGEPPIRSCGLPDRINQRRRVVATSSVRNAI